jgi:hypothetical protein
MDSKIQSTQSSTVPDCLKNGRRFFGHQVRWAAANGHPTLRLQRPLSLSKYEKKPKKFKMFLFLISTAKDKTRAAMHIALLQLRT